MAPEDEDDEFELQTMKCSAAYSSRDTTYVDDVIATDWT